MVESLTIFLERKSNFLLKDFTKAARLHSS